MGYVTNWYLVWGHESYFEAIGPIAIEAPVVSGSGGAVLSSVAAGPRLRAERGCGSDAVAPRDVHSTHGSSGVGGADGVALQP